MVYHVYSARANGRSHIIGLTRLICWIRFLRKKCWGTRVIGCAWVEIQIHRSSIKTTADFPMLQSTYKHHLSTESQGPYYLWKLPTSRKWRPVSITKSEPQLRVNSHPLLAIQPGMLMLEPCFVSHTGQLSTPILNPLGPTGYPRCESTVPPALHTCILICRV